MTTAIIITFCTLLLIAYMFDLTSSKTKIPSVILLLILGWLVSQLTNLLEIRIPVFTSTLPVLGTVGLILIVLEGSLGLELNRSKITLITKSFIGAFLTLIASAFILAYAFQYYGGYTFKDSLTNAIPFCVISSAIAIPSVRHLTSSSREFIIYESSLSDIFGVILFNFVAFNTTFGLQSFGHFSIQLLLIIMVSFIATIGLSFLLSKIENHVKFVPIILLVILIYTISKIYHLPALIFIMMFGLFISNLDELKQFKWIKKFKPEILNIEVQKFKELTTEAAFLVRSLFFLLFGFMMKTSEMLNIKTLPWALGVVITIFLLRVIQLTVSKQPLMPLLFIAPRGLITILLFLSIEPSQTIGLVNESLIIQVIIISALFMMIGLLLTKHDENIKLHPEKPPTVFPETQPISNTENIIQQ